MGAFKAKQARANPPVCWGCDRRLFAGGRIYELVDGKPYHKTCAEQKRAEENPVELADAISLAAGWNGWS